MAVDIATLGIEVQSSGVPLAKPRLGDLEKKVDEQSGGERVEGLSSRQIFLIVISFLVCMVGIANAMLIAITERYKEIATMKCLGALDWFVVELFLLEALALGALGSAAGSLAGTVMAMLPWFFRGTELAAATLPWASLGLNFLVGLGTGMLLTVIGSLYPAYRASRMVPAEAMRRDV